MTGRETPALVQFEMTHIRSEYRLATLPDVREHSERATVELWCLVSGRVVVRCFNECGNNHTDLDLGDLLEWAQHGRLSALRTSERD
jgi:hypothetical protein